MGFEPALRFLSQDLIFSNNSDVQIPSVFSDFRKNRIGAQGLKPFLSHLKLFLNQFLIGILRKLIKIIQTHSYNRMAFTFTLHLYLV